MEQTTWSKETVPGEVELAVWKAGSGEEPLLAVHGITAQHRAFNAAARHLGDAYTLYGVDLRGRGESGKPEEGYGLEAHAGDLIRTLDHLGIEQTTILGHSMGAFVGMKAALDYPDRIRSLVLLDGGWPRIEVSQEELTEEQEQEAADFQAGLQRAYSRLDMVFETPEDYLNFWFPDQDFTYDDLPPDLADYYRYDLGSVEGGYQPKALYAAALQDSEAVSGKAPTADELRGVGCPIALVRATEGFFPGTEPLIPDDTRDVMAEVLDLRAQTLLDGANHYSMMFDPFARQWVEYLRGEGIL